MTVEEIVRRYRLEPHPEGGFFRETYRAAGTVAGRAYSTAIYYLLPAGAISRLHRIRCDEIWHFYLGGPMSVATLHEDGREDRTLLGPGHALQHVVPAGAWFGAWPEPGTAYSLVGCTVAPGFEFADLEIAQRAPLLARYPHAHELIERLTRDR